MKIRIKVAFLFLFVFMTALNVSGCETNLPEPAADIPAVADNKLVLMTKDNNLENFDLYIKNMEKATGLDIEVVAEPLNPNDRLAKISTILSSGDKSVDILNINDEMLSSFKWQGYLEPLQIDVMTDEVKENFHEKYLKEMCMTGENIYSVPMHMEFLAFCVDTKRLEECGIESIENKEQFVEFLKRCREKGIYGYGGAWEKSYAFNEIGQFINMFGGDFFDWSNEKTIEAMKFIKTLASEDLISIDSMVQRYDAMLEKFTNGEYGCVFMWNGVNNSTKNNENTNHMAPVPVFEKETVYTATWHYVLNKSSTSKENAYKFLKYAASKEGQLMEAEVLNRVPARYDAIYDESFDTYDLEVTKDYIENTELKARPIPHDSMAFIDSLGSIYQKYMLDEIEIEEFCTGAQELVDMYFK